MTNIELLSLPVGAKVFGVSGKMYINGKLCLTTKPEDFGVVEYTIEEVRDIVDFTPCQKYKIINLSSATNSKRLYASVDTNSTLVDMFMTKKEALEACNDYCNEYLKNAQQELLVLLDNFNRTTAKIKKRSRKLSKELAELDA